MKWINRAREQVETVEALDTCVTFCYLTDFWIFTGFIWGFFLAKIEEVCYLKDLILGHETAQKYRYSGSQKHFVHRHF